MPLTDEEALRNLQTRRDWREVVQPNLSGGRLGEWHKYSGPERREMTMHHIKTNASLYRHLLVKGSAATPAKGCGSARFDGFIPELPRRIVEFCADENSNIGEVADPTTCEVIRFTKRRDVCSKPGRERAMRAIKSKAQTLLWGSMPCTGGSTRSPQDPAKGGSAAATVMAHRELFEAIWYNFTKVALETHHRGGKIAIEWPNGCLYSK